MQKTIVAIIIVFLVSVIIGALFLIVFNGTGTRHTQSETAKETSGKAVLPNETLLVSDDGGENWKFADIPGKMDTTDIFLSKKNPGKVFLITPSDIFVKEKDNNSWNKLFKSSLEKGSVYYFLTEDGGDNLYISIYSLNFGRVARYNLNDNGQEEIFQTPLQRYAVFGVQARDENNLKIVSSDGGFYKSEDAGFSWKIIKRFKDGLLNLTENKKTGDFWVPTSKGGILKISADDKIRDVSFDLKRFDKASAIKQISYDENSGFLYLASGYGVLRSKNGEDNWDALPLILPPESLPVNSVAAHPYDAKIIYAGSLNKFYKSDDDGKSWRIIDLPTTRTISRIAVDLNNPKTIYIGLTK